jgi:hypothetical protein
MDDRETVAFRSLFTEAVVGSDLVPDFLMNPDPREF